MRISSVLSLSFTLFIFLSFLLLAEDGVARYKCVAEFRVSHSRFMDISRDSNIKLTDIEKEMEKVSMFVYGQTQKTCQGARLGQRHEFE